MKSNSPADHYLQLDIIRKLYASDSPLSFSRLKDDGIENSLFMYHMNKLISRKVVDKYQDGFALTKAGAYWANNSGLGTLNPVATPKVLVQLLIFSEDNSKILLSKRKGSASELINHYILPGKAVEVGTSHLERAKQYAVELGVNSELSYSGVYEFIRRHDSFSYHNVAFVYTAQQSNVDLPQGEEFYEYRWVLLQEILTTSQDVLLVSLIKRYQETSSIDQLTLVIED